MGPCDHDSPRERPPSVTSPFCAGNRGALLLLAAWCASACAVPETAPPAARVEPVLLEPQDTTFDGAVRIASVFPALGRYALSGLQSHKGAQLAVEELNRRGGVRGRRLKLVQYRTGSYFVDARHAATRAVARDGAVAIIGSNSSSLSQAVAEVAESHGVVQVSNVSTAQDLTWDPATGVDRRFVFRVCGSDVVMGERLAVFARDHLGARRVALLYEVGRTYSAKLARSFVDHFADAAAGRACAEFFYLPLETDFRDQLRGVAAFRPDVIFVPGSFTDTTLIAVQARRLGLHPTLLGGDAWSNHLLFKRGGPDRPAFYGDHCVLPESFAKRYRARFGEEADGCRAVLSYDAVQAVAAALSRMGPLSDQDLMEGVDHTRKRLRDALAAVSFKGETGSIRFDAHGDVRRGIAITQVRPTEGGYVWRPHLWLGER